MTVKARRDRVRDTAVGIYVKTLRRNSEAFGDLKEQAERTIDYCKKKGYPEPKFAMRILDLVTKQLDFIMCREAELKALTRTVAEGQLDLADIPVEDELETLPEGPENRLHIARGLIVDNTNNSSEREREEKRLLSTTTTTTTHWRGNQ